MKSDLAIYIGSNFEDVIEGTGDGDREDPEDDDEDDSYDMEIQSNQIYAVSKISTHSSAEVR